MQNKKTQQLVIDAMLCAMCAVLGYISLDLGSIKITFESLPILLGALLFGPLDGGLIGAAGTLIYQLLRYGFSATTLLWMLPYIIMGLLVGFIAKRLSFKLTKIQLGITVLSSELLVTLLNTGVIYIDSVIYGYYSPTIITASLVIRLVICVVKAVLFAVALFAVIAAVKKYAPAKTSASE